MNTWYVIAKEDKRKKYGYNQIIKSAIFDFKKAVDVKHQTEKQLNKKLVILKRTCVALK